MKNSVVNWHGYENYNMNCNIEDLKKRGFEFSSYNNDLAPSYTNKKGNIQVFFIDLDSDEMKAEKMTYKFSVMKLDEHGEYSETIGTTNSFEKMLKAFNKAGIRVCIDYVMNHVADTHQWAQKALDGDKEYQALFEMYDDRTIPDIYDKTVPEVLPDKCPGNFTYKEEIKKWVYTSFSNFQWDLNFRNPKVFELIVDIMLHLSNLGINMLRLDAIPFIWKELHTNCRNLRTAHEIIAMMQTIKKIICPSLILLGEAIVEPHEIFKYFGEHDNECDVLYNANLMVNIWNAYATRDSRLLYEDNRQYQAPKNTCWMNYVRCHDDIGWGFNESAISSYGMNPYDHKQFLIHYYSGHFPNSFAKGEIYQFNPINNDARTNGTLASLLGLEKAKDKNDSYAKEVSLRRINMAHALIISHNGIPLIYSGDEIATTNDYSYLQDKDKKLEGRWVHRPFFDWKRAKDRNDTRTPEGVVFTETKKIITLRKKHRIFNSDIPVDYVQFYNNSVYTFYKKDKNNQLYCLFNFSENNQYVDTFEPHSKGINFKAIDLITGKKVDLSEQTIHLHPYETLWLIPDKKRGK